MLFIPPLLLADIITFVIQFIVATIAFFLAGRLFSGVNAKPTDAIFVALLGLLLQLGIDMLLNIILIPGLNEIVLFAWNIVGLLATFIVWMILVQYFFDTLFLRGLGIVLIATLFMVVIDFSINYLFMLLFPGP